MPHATYFVTICTGARRPVLNLPTVASSIQQELTAIERDGHLTVLAGVVMPDHVHLLVSLGDTFSLGRVIARLKSRTKRQVNAAGGDWQGNYYEHRMRPDEPESDVIRYLFLNPYRDGLIAADEKWPWFWLGAETAEWFTPMLDDGRPFPEWLK